VQIADTEVGATTKADGRFTISNVPAGIFTLRVSRIACKQVILRDIRVSTGATFVADFKMSSQSVIPGVVITTGLSDPSSGTRAHWKNSTTVANETEVRLRAPAPERPTIKLFPPPSLPRQGASSQAVTATSGDSTVIAAIQATLTATNRDSLRFRRTEHTLLEYSAGDAKLVALYDGASLRKLSAYLGGESGNLIQHLYFSADRVVYVQSVYEQYETKSRVEHRVYLSADQPIRRIRTQSQARPTEAVASWDPLPELLGRVKAFVACAASVAATCSAPRR